MTNSEAIEELLDVLTISALRELVDGAHLSVSDRRSRNSILVALLAHYDRLDALLLDLSDDVLHDLCGSLELLPEGSPAVMRRRIHEALLDDDDSPSTAVTLAPGPWGARQAQRDHRSSDSGEVSEISQESAMSPWIPAFGIAAGILALGRARNEVQYLYPTRGNVIASGRRRNNPIAALLSGLRLIGTVVAIGVFIMIILLSALGSALHAVLHH